MIKNKILLNGEKVDNDENLNKSIKSLLYEFNITHKFSLPFDVIDLFEQQYDESQDDYISQKINITISNHTYKINVCIHGKQKLIQEVGNSLNEVYSLNKEDFRKLLKEEAKHLQLDYAPLKTNYVFFRLEYFCKPQIVIKESEENSSIEITFNVDI